MGTVPALFVGLLLLAPQHVNPRWPERAVPAVDAARMSGKEVIACGRVMGMRLSPEIELTIAMDAPEPLQTLLLVVSRADLPKLQPHFDIQLRLREVCVTGRVSRQNGIPSMRLARWSQFKWFGEPPAELDFHPGVARPTVEVPWGAIGIQGPSLISRVEPIYMVRALEQRMQGTVVLEVVVETDGSVGDVRLVRSIDPFFGLDASALIAAKQWRFAPATRDGKAVAVIVALHLNFGILAEGARAP